MKFYEKLDFLMDLTSITNSKLAKTLNIDPSLVSRWRRGIRVPSNFASTVAKIADVLALRFQYDYQKKSLAKKASISVKLLSEETIKESLVVWLSTDDNLSAVQDESVHVQHSNNTGATHRIWHEDRKDVLRTLKKSIGETNSGSVLRVYTNKPTSWVNAITKLNQNEVVKTVSRLKALKLMIPSSVSYEDLRILWKQIEVFLDKTIVYVTILDRESIDVFQHTIFIVGDYALSASFGFYEQDSIFMGTEKQKKIIRNFIQGFDYAFNGGQPGLMYLEHYEMWEYLEVFEQIFSKNEATYYFGSVLNPLLMPPVIFRSIAQKSVGVKDLQDKRFLDLQKHLFLFLKNNAVYTTIPLFTPAEIKKKKAYVPNTLRMLDGKPTINHAQYQAILIYAADVYERFDNLHVMLLQNDVSAACGMQESYVFCVAKTNNSKTVAYRSYHRGVISAAKRILEEKFHAYEAENSKDVVLDTLKNQIALFDESSA